MRGAADIETGALILAVDSSELRDLKQLMQQLEPTTIPLESTPSRPGTHAVRALRIELGGDSVVVTIEDDRASLMGSPAGFARLAHEIGLFGEYNDLSEPGMHAHFDPGGASAEGGVLSEDSRPLVISGPVSDDPIE